MYAVSASRPRRLSALAEAGILDRAPEGTWDRLTRFGATVLRTPMTAITVITEDRQIILSHQGIPEPLGTQRMTPVESSFCHHVVRSAEPLIVDDTRTHPLVQDSPLIRDYGMLAYAGWPWRTPDGHVQGTFCAMDVLPRSWTPAEIRILQELADLVTDTVALRPAAVRGFAGMPPQAEILLNQSHVGVCVFQGARIRYANARFAEILGYSERELLDLAEASSLIVEEDRPGVIERSRRCLGGELERAPHIFRCRRKDGQIVWLEMQVSRAIIERTPSVVGVVSDVTHWKRAEESIQEGEDRLRLLVRATNDFTWEWEITSGALQWDEAAPRVLRYEPDEMGGSFEWWGERIHAEDRDPVTAGLNSLLNGSGNLWTVEYRFRRGDGSDATLLTRGYVARSARGVPLRMTCAMIDVSERRQAEDAQRFLARASTLLAESLEPDFSLAGLIDLIVPSLADFCVIQVLGENGFPAPTATGHVVPAKAEFLKPEVVGVEGGTRWAILEQTAYVATGTRLIVEDAGPPARELEGRVGPLPPVEQRMHLVKGDVLVLTRDQLPGRPARLDESGNVVEPARIACTPPEALDGVRAGERIWFDEGRIGGVIRSVEKAAALVEVTSAKPTGSNLRGEKGINLPDSALSFPPLMGIDLEHLPFIARHADLIGYSFVRSADDIRSLQARLAEVGGAGIGIVLKIETAQAFEQLPDLLLAAMRSPILGVMIARGDLAVECGFPRLAEVQEEILWLCEAAHVPVIWATQVLEQLAKTGRPSRAEVTDAAMAERAECVMLNKGPYVVDAVRALDSILQRMQTHQEKKRPTMRSLHVADSFFKANGRPG